MKNNFNDWKILKHARHSDFIIIAVITLIFLFVIAMNIRLIFEMTSNQTEQIGQMQLENIRSDLSGTISNAEAVTTRVGLEAEQLLNSGADIDEVSKFFYEQKAEQNNLTNGVCFNVYIASKDWAVIPDFNMPEDYHAQERIWYKGAIENPDKVFITEPYIDAMSNEMCFTMSKMLSDGSTVVGLDFNFSDTKKSVLKMTSNNDSTALIVTKTGKIIGYTDMSLVGQNISRKLPEYENILQRITASKNHESFLAEIDGRTCTIFSSETKNGWYMILSVYNWALYKNSYQQIFFTTALSLIMILVIIFFYLHSIKNSIEAKEALHVKEEFLSRLSKELREPLQKILSISSTRILDDETNPRESAAQVRESALKLSGMLDNLFSFSTMVESDKKSAVHKDIVQDHELARISKIARIGILAVLISSMIFSLIVYVNTTLNWGDTKMNREVDIYEHQLSKWIENQKSILEMFANIISENPELMENYEDAVNFLNEIAQHYPEISVCYLANPYNEHQVIMNNGWESPDPNWKVDQRQWYIDTGKSENGFNVSAPYYDDQTGLYCVTLSQIVYGKDGEFLGVFAIDFFLDRLIQILGESYTNSGYAFLVDRNGIVINHPNNLYQMSVNRMTDIAGTEYAQVYYSDRVKTLTDYRGNIMACLSKKNKTSDFTVIVANSWWNIYSNILIMCGVFLILIVICILIVQGLINKMIKWQKSANLQLKTAADKATLAGQAKTQFLAQMSHEIRTPINAVLGMNEMILRESKDTDILDYASNIQSAGRTLLTLINSILDFSKIEEGKLEIIPVRYETIILIDDLVNMISEKAKKKGLEFKTEIDSYLPKTLYGDDVRIRQVITNILTNAVKYTHEGFVTLTISGKATDEDTFILAVEVSDTGIGIRPEDKDKLFQSFQRLDEEKNRNIEGTGLGMAIVQKLLSMMGSKLQVESEYGHGSTFYFNLTQKIIDKNPIGIYEEHHRTHEKHEKRFLKADGAKILAVDDNSMNLKVIRGLLKRNGIVPDMADSGKQCIEMAAKNFYHIIFLDNMMPGMNGVETLKKMKAENILSKDTAVVMLTASAIAGMRETYLREGFDDYLSKPIEIEELENILAKHLPEEIVSYEDEIKSEPVEVVEEKIPEPEEISDSDEFSERERKKFNETCPDIDLDTGLSYCMDSKSFLIELLEEFKEDEKSVQIEKSFGDGDWKNYQILVHALKSTALVIGAADLSEFAKKLELAAKADNIDLIRAEHENLMSDYKKVREQIKNWLEG